MLRIKHIGANHYLQKAMDRLITSMIQQDMIANTRTSTIQRKTSIMKAAEVKVGCWHAITSWDGPRAQLAWNKGGGKYVLYHPRGWFINAYFSIECEVF